jgi:hypothetical protein
MTNIRHFRFFFILLLLVIGTGSREQDRPDWITSYGTPRNEEGNRITCDKAGNIYFSGMYQEKLQIGPLTLSSSSATIHNFLCSSDKSNHPSWAFDFNSPFTYLFDLSADRDDKILVAGSFADSLSFNGISMKSKGGSNSFLFRMDNVSGKILLSKQITSNNTQVQFRSYVDADKNINLTGFFSKDITIDNMNLQKDDPKSFFIARINQQGVCESLKALDLWAEGESSDCTAFDGSGSVFILVSVPGEIYYNGKSRKPDRSFSVLLKYSMNGDFLWAKDVPGTFPSGDVMAVDGQGSVSLVGAITKRVILEGDTIQNLYGRSDVISLKYDKNGKLIWKNTAGGPGEDIALALCQDNRGNLYMTGKVQRSGTFGKFSYTARNYSDIFLAKINPAGEYEWMRDLAGYPEARENKPLNGESTGRSCIVDPTGQLCFTGSMRTDLEINLNGKILNLRCQGGSDILIGKINPFE